MLPESTRGALCRAASQPSVRRPPPLRSSATASRLRIRLGGTPTSEGRSWRTTPTESPKSSARHPTASTRRSATGSIAHPRRRGISTGSRSGRSAAGSKTVRSPTFRSPGRSASASRSRSAEPGLAALLQRRQNLALEQLEAAAVVGRLREVVDRVAEPELLHVAEPLHDLLRRADGQRVAALVLGHELRGAL